MSEENKNNSYTLSLLIGELLFVILPFAVLFLIFLYQSKDALSYIMAPEWAFASSILLGQTIVKFVQGVIESTKIRKPVVERVGLVVSILIVFGLVPSMVILALVLTSRNPPVWLGFTQIILFILSVIVFFFIGGAANEATCEARNHKD